MAAALVAAATGLIWAALAFMLMTELAGISGETSDADGLRVMILVPVVLLLCVVLPIVGAICCWQRSHRRPALIALLQTQIPLAACALLAATPASTLVS